MSCRVAFAPSRTWWLSRLARTEATAGLQMSQPRPRAVGLDDVVEAVVAVDGHDLEELLAGHREVLAQRLVDDLAGRGEMVLDDLLDDRLARAAGRAGLGALGDAAGVGARAAVVEGGVVGDGRLDLRLGDVVAGADLRLVRQSELDTATATGGEDQLLRVRRQLHAAADHGAQDAVRRRVADQDAAEQLEAAVVVLLDDELLVDAGHRVSEDQLQAVVARAEGVAEGGDVDAEQLELGGHVGAGEGTGRAAEEGVDDDLGHRVAGRDQAVHPAARRGALADRPDVLVRAAALLVDQHAAALGDVEAGLAGDRVAGADAGGEDDQVEGQGVLVLELDAGDLPVGVAVDQLGHHAGVDGEAELLDVPLEGRATGVVDLHRHQPRRHLDHVGLHAELVQRVGRLQAEQSTTDDRAGPRALRRLADRLEVLDRAVDEDVVEVLARHRRHERRRTRGEDQLVVADGVAVGEDHLLGLAVDADDLGLEQELDPRVVVHALGEVGERLGAHLEEGGQGDAVVRRAGLLAEHDDVVGLGQPALDRGLDEAVADHAVADDDQLLAEVRCHVRTPSGTWPAQACSGSRAAA